jgi:hypothetical protein
MIVEFCKSVEGLAPGSLLTTRMKNDNTWEAGIPRPGTDVMIFQIVLPKKWRKNGRF